MNDPLLAPDPPEAGDAMTVFSQIIEDWKYVAQVLDRLFLWIFTVAVLVGTAGIIFQVNTNNLINNLIIKLIINN